MAWKLVWTRPALKDMKKLDQRLAIVKLTDVDPPEWRQRVGDWRVFLQPHAEPKELHVLRVKKREQAY
jgi:mRNA-degrading endonuclease RelE of RelBE toxin-antitoxin system